MLRIFIGLFLLQSFATYGSDKVKHLDLAGPTVKLDESGPGTARAIEVEVVRPFRITHVGFRGTLKSGQYRVEIYESLRSQNGLKKVGLLLAHARRKILSSGHSWYEIAIPFDFQKNKRYLVHWAPTNGNDEWIINRLWDFGWDKELPLQIGPVVLLDGAEGFPINFGNAVYPHLRFTVKRKLATNVDEFGVGFILGEPTGLTAKYYFNKKNAVDVGLAYSFGSFVMFYGDYLWHYYDLIKSKRDRNKQFLSQLGYYLGVGAVVFIGGSKAKFEKRAFTNEGRSSVGLGVRVPFGIEWRPNEPTIGIHLELAPGVGMVPSIYAFLQGGLGIRYYF